MKGYFRKPADFYSYHFLTSIFSQNKHITYKQNPLLATKLFWLLSFLTFSPLTTFRFLSRRDSPIHPVNLYNSVSLDPVSIPALLFWGSPHMSLIQKALASRSRSICSLNIPGFTIFPPCTEDLIDWPMLSRLNPGPWGRIDNRSLRFGPFCLSSGFPTCSG